MIYITGDKHGDYTDVFGFCKKYKTSKNDLLIILEDAGLLEFEKVGRESIYKNTRLIDLLSNF